VLSDFPDIKKYQEEINKILDERPEFREFQENIETELEKAGSQHNRNVVLQNMMIEKVNELKEKLRELMGDC